MNGWLKPLKKKKICSTRGGCFIDHDSYSELKILGKQGAETIIDALLKKKTMKITLLEEPDSLLLIIKHWILYKNHKNCCSSYVVKEILMQI